MSILNHSIKELEEKLKNKEITATELVEASIARIKEVDSEIHAFITLDEENALQRAKALDEEGVSERALFAIPGALKDNIMTKGVKTTCASKMLENFDEPLYDATVVTKLNEAGAVSLGKTNLDEFAMGSTTETSAFHQTKNPWNTEHVPGGSSGGSAAAVASGEVLFALGTDTGGSVRQPASFTGIVGMKPTYGLVSRSGVVAFSSSLDHVGVMTRRVEDNARVTESIVGQDPEDQTTIASEKTNFTDSLTGDINGLKVAVPKEFLNDDVDQEVKEQVEAAIDQLKSLGATVEEVSLPNLETAVKAYYIISSAEASTGMARFDGVRYGKRSENAENMIDMYKKSRSEGFGEEVKRRILLGSVVLSAGYTDDYFIQAQKVRTLIINEFNKIFDAYDVIVGPTTPTVAYKLGEAESGSLKTYTNDLLTAPVNLIGAPAITVPCGFSEAGLPIGLQIIGKRFNDQTVYRVAHAYEQSTDHHTKRPNLGGAN